MNNADQQKHPNQNHADKYKAQSQPEAKQQAGDKKTFPQDPQSMKNANADKKKKMNDENEDLERDRRMDS